MEAGLLGSSPAEGFASTTWTLQPLLASSLPSKTQGPRLCSEPLQTAPLPPPPWALGGGAVAAPLAAGVGGACRFAWSPALVPGASGALRPALGKLLSQLPSSPGSSSRAGGAGPHSHPLASGTALSPVAWQPPGAARATAVLIPQGRFRCVSLGSQGAGAPGPGQHQPPVPYLAWRLKCPCWCPAGAPWRAPHPGHRMGMTLRALWGPARVSRPFSRRPAPGGRWFLCGLCPPHLWHGRSGAQAPVPPSSGLGPGDFANCKVPLRPCPMRCGGLSCTTAQTAPAAAASKPVATSN